MLTSKNLWRDGRQNDPGSSTPFFVLNLDAPYEKSFYVYGQHFSSLNCVLVQLKV